MKPRGILETSLCARDLAAAEAFYRDVLGLAVYSFEPGRHVFFRCGSDMFLVFNPEGTRRDRVVINGVALPNHGTDGAGHVAFRITEDEIKGWKARLHQHHVAIEAEVVWPNGGRSLYFRDPAGNSIELATPRLWGLPED